MHAGFPLEFFNFLPSAALWWASLVVQLVKNPPAMQETPVQSLGWESPGEGKGYSLQYSGLKGSMDYSPGVAKSGTWLSNFHFLSFSQHYGMIVRNLYLSKSSFYKPSWGGSIFAKSLEWKCVYEWQKDLKPTVKKKKKITMQLTNKLGYWCNIQHLQIIIRIITDNILPGHIRISETSYNF